MHALTRSLGLAATLALVAAACGGRAPEPVEIPPPETIGPPSPSPTEPEESPTGGSLTVEVWFASGEEATLFVTTRTQETTQAVGSQAVGRAAMEALLAGPNDAEAAAGVVTAVPPGTRLLGLQVEGGIATVDLSREFEGGGGTTSELLQIAQVVYTLTQFPTVKGVRFEIEGRPVSLFGGQGIILEEPQTRKDFEDLLPVILVESPVIGQRVESPVTVSGSANVFEATVVIRILDAAGTELVNTFTTATCGTGCRGDYSMDVPFEVNTEQAGTVIVEETDPSGGEGFPPRSVAIPVTLVP